MKKEIMGLELESQKEEEVLDKLLSLLDREKLDICALIRMGMILEAEENEEYRTFLQELTLRIPGDGEVKKALGEETEKEGDEGFRFLGELLQTLQERETPLALITEKKEKAREAQEFLKNNFPSLKLQGILAMEEFEDEDDAINHINGLDAEILLADLSIPRQETFAFANQGKLHLKVWLGIGGRGSSGKKMEKIPGIFEKFLEKRLFKKKVSRYTREKEG